MSAWLAVLLTYLTYAALAVSTTDVATKVWCATAFVVVSVGVWAFLRHRHNGRQK